MWPLMFGLFVTLAWASPARRHEPSMNPCVDMVDDCSSLVANGICLTDSSHLCALTCQHCLPNADNIGRQPFIEVDVKHPPTPSHPNPFPDVNEDQRPPLKELEDESNTGGEHIRSKRQIPDPFKKEQIIPIEQQPKPDVQKIPPYDYNPDINIPFPRKLEDQFQYPTPIVPQISHPLKKEDQINTLPLNDPDDQFPFPHRDPTERRPFPHFDPRDQLPRPHQLPEGQLPFPDRNPASNIPKPKETEDLKVRHKRQIDHPLKRQFNPYGSSSSEEVDGRIPRPWPYQQIPPFHTGPNQQIPSQQHHHKGKKPKGNKKGDQLETTNGQTPNNHDPIPLDSFEKKQTNDEGIHVEDKRRVVPDLPDHLPDVPDHLPDFDPTKVNDKQLDEPLKKKDQFPYPSKKNEDSRLKPLGADTKMIKADANGGDSKLPENNGKLPGDISHLPESNRKDKYPFPDKKVGQDPIEHSRQVLPPIDKDKNANDKKHMKQFGMGTNPFMDPYNPLSPANSMNPLSPTNPFSINNPLNPLSPNNPMNMQNPLMNPYGGLGGLNGFGVNGLGGLNGFGRSPFSVFPNKQDPNTEGGEKTNGKEHDSNSPSKSNSIIGKQIKSPDDIKNPKEGPPSIVKRHDGDRPDNRIPVPDEVPRDGHKKQQQMNKPESYPRPTPARPLPDPKPLPVDEQHQ